MARQRKAGDEEVALDASTGIEQRASAQPYVQLSFQLPAFYVRVLDHEAELVSQRRSTFLELLVLRKAGVVRFEPVAGRTRYRVDRRELHELERYVWHCRREIKERLDALRERMGNIPPRSWVILALNEWIGLPSGVSDLDEERRAESAARRRAPPPPPSRRKRS